jgi:hypothetical protein
MLRNVVTLFLACGISAFAAAQEAPPPASQPRSPATQPVEPSPEALAAFGRLDDPDYSQREQAEMQLLELVIAQPALADWIQKQADSSPSPEVRTRLASVLAKLAEHRLLGATIVSLQVKEVHPRELVAELSRQSGVRVEYWPPDPWQGGGPSGGRVSLELEGTPFWEALRRVCESTGLNPMEHQPAAPGTIVLSPHGEQFGTSPTHHHGAFAVQLRRLYRNQSAHVELGVDADGRIGGNTSSNSSLALEMRLLVEPKIRLTASAAQPVLDEVVDENGNDLNPIDEAGRRMGGRGGWTNSNTAWSVQTNFPLDAKAAAQSRMISRLSGRMEAEVATEMVRLEINVSDLADIRRMGPDEKVSLSKRYTVGQYRIELTSLRRSPDEAIYIDFVVTPQRGISELQEDWSRLQTLSNALRLEDAAGRQWTPTGGGTSWENNSARMSRGFQRSGENVGPPIRLVWELPARTMTVSIPFEFTDVPLPSWE